MYIIKNEIASVSGVKLQKYSIKIVTPKIYFV
jgi:hypothetical protein